MKNLIVTISIVLALASCKEEAPKDYVTLSGTITNQNSDSLVVLSRTYTKKISVNEDGTFKDTLKVENGTYTLFDGLEVTSLYLMNGFDLKLSLDTKEFDETIAYTGTGAETNNYLAKKRLLNETAVNFEEMMSLDRAGFNEKLNTVTAKFKSLLSATKNLETAFVANQEKEIEMMSKELTGMFKAKQTLLAMNGKASPKFVDYENNAGGNTSLDDLKGKYVYIDMWATWCGPCKREIPFLKEVEKTYHSKNIAFVSISIDSQKDYNTWKEMIIEKELTGIQLYAKEDKVFADEYKISGIPRFILIDPNGNVVNADAPRPSSKEIRPLLDTLLNKNM